MVGIPLKIWLARNLGWGYKEVFVEIKGVGRRGMWLGEHEHVHGPLKCRWRIGVWKRAGELWVIEEASEMS